MPRSGIGIVDVVRSSETRLLLVLTVLAGFVGAAAFTHSTNYFVTAMSGNAQRAVLGWFTGASSMAAGAVAITIAFLLGVVAATVLQRLWWENHPYAAITVNASLLIAASAVDLLVSPHDTDLGLVPVLFAAAGLGALNTAFVKNGEVALPITYFTGTVVKIGQGLVRHAHGGTSAEWAGYVFQYLCFIGGAVLGGLASRVISGPSMLYAATAVSIATASFTFLHGRRDRTDSGSSAPAQNSRAEEPESAAR